MAQFFSSEATGSELKCFGNIMPSYHVLHYKILIFYRFVFKLNAPVYLAKRHGIELKHYSTVMKHMSLCKENFLFL